MQHLRLDTGAASVRASRFAVDGGAEEVHLCLRPPAEPHAAVGQLAALEAAYANALIQLRLPPETAVFRRLFVSDWANQADLVARSTLVTGDEASGPVAVSVVEEPPLPAARVALWAWHLRDAAPLDKAPHGDGVLVRRGPRTHLWTAGLSAPTEEGPPDPAAQTRALFAEYEGQLAGLGASLADHVVRTWVFVRDVDVNYAGMVDARRELFAARGLTAETHYLASTGIEGRHADHRRTVLLDAWAIAGLDPGQVRHLEALHRLGPTHAYGVTFERGTRIAHGDRAHLVISGTASIEPDGRTVHRGDIERQTERTFGNIEALLADGGAALTDLAQVIVYLRDAADRAPVESWLDAHLPDVPRVVVRAPVCRPGWLVEVEGLAVVADDSPWPAL